MGYPFIIQKEIKTHSLESLSDRISHNDKEMYYNMGVLTQAPHSSSICVNVCRNVNYEYTIHALLFISMLFKNNILPVPPIYKFSSEEF